MKNNKLISALLALLVCLSLVVSVSAAGSAEAESPVTFTVEASASTVKPGDSVTVTVGVTENTGFYYALLSLNYDHELFEIERDANGAVTSIQIEKNTADFGDNLFVGNNGTGIVTIVVGGSPFTIFNKPEEATKFEKNGTLIKATFTVKDTVDEDVVGLFTLNATPGNLLVNAVGGADKYPEKVDVDYIQNCNIVSPNHDCGNYEPVIDPAVPATCVDSGKSEGSHCLVCLKVLVMQRETPPEGHKFGDWEVTKEATSKAPGEESRVCSVCGEIETREIPQRSAISTPVLVALIIAGVALIALVAVFVIRKKKLFFWK